MRSFRSLLYVIFVGNFVDNAFRLLAWMILSSRAIEAGVSPDTDRTLLGVFYTAPMLVFSIMSGQLADRMSKRNLLGLSRFLEFLIWSVALVSFQTTQSNTLVLMLLLFLGVRMTLSGPASTGLIAELLPENKITWGNSWFESMTYVAAVLGVSIGGLSYDFFQDNLSIPIAVLAALAASGTVVSLTMEKTPAAEPTRKITILPYNQLKSNITEIMHKPGMNWAVIANTFWWTLAALALVVSMKLAQDTLLLDGRGVSFFFIYLGVGIGLGSLVAGRLSKPHTELGLIPIGGILMGVACILVLVLPKQEFISGICISFVGFFSGWYIVPVKAYIQRSASKETRGGILGTVNFFQYAAIFFSSGLVYYILTKVLHLSAEWIFFWIGVILITTSVWVFIMMPKTGLRFVLYWLVRIMFRTRVKGLKNVPKTGGALLVTNHTSYADGIIMTACLDRLIRPIIYDEMYENKWVQFFINMSEPIPISDRMGPRELIKSLKTATEAINEGSLVLIFAEGQISRTGQLLPFHKGLERIMKDTQAPIIPVGIDGLRNQFTGIGKNRKIRWKPRGIQQPVSLIFGKAMPTHTKAEQLHGIVQRLLSKCWEIRKPYSELVHRNAFKAAKRHPLQIACYDQKTPEGIKRWQFAVGIIIFAKLLKKEWASSHRVGICLPPSIGGAIINHAALLAGKVVVNLNYSASSEVVAHICKDAEIDVVITSKEFLEKIKLDLPGRVLFAEDLKEKVTPSLKKKSLVDFLFKSVRHLEMEAGQTKAPSPSDDASIIYSSGSTGIPKGVCLTHWNFASNMQAIDEIIPLSHEDTLLGILPFFHSFGTLVALFLVHQNGMKVSYLPNPLDARSIGTTVRKHKCTFLVATPTFLQAYTRMVDPRDFGSLRMVVTGAEKLRTSVAVNFEKKFGIAPKEAYGCTELSPGVALNTDNYRAPGILQMAEKPGTIGMPFPGVSVKVVDPATHEERERGEEGLLLVKGPNVMQGYLNMPDKSAEVLIDGWYVTGDIARIDEDGFIQITDRLSRFSKIGGEMVPHINIEEALCSKVEKEEVCFCVTSVEDKAKGEKLVVLYTVKPDAAKAAHQAVSKDPAFPKIWVPKFTDFYQVDAIPLLGSGKTDLKKVKSLAVELDSPKG